MAETRTVYGLSDIKSVLVLCSEYEKEMSFRWDFGFHDPYEQHVKVRCQHCEKYGFDGTFLAIRRLKCLAQESSLDLPGSGPAKNLLSRIRIEVEGV